MTLIATPQATRQCSFTPLPRCNRPTARAVAPLARMPTPLSPTRSFPTRTPAMARVTRRPVVISAAATPINNAGTVVIPNSTGVPDVDAAAVAKDNAIRLDLLPVAAASKLSLVQFDPVRDDISELLTMRNARLLLIVGDSINGRKTLERRAADRLLKAVAQQEQGSLGQLVVVNAQRVSGGLFSLSGGSSGTLTPAEQEIAISGVPTAILRLATSDNVDEEYGKVANVVLGPQGSLALSSARITKFQAAETVAAVVLQAGVRGGRNSSGSQCVVLEAAAEQEAELIGGSVAAAVAEALPSGVVTLEEDDDEYEDGVGEERGDAALSGRA